MPNRIPTPVPVIGETADGWFIDLDDQTVSVDLPPADIEHLKRATARPVAKQPDDALPSAPSRETTLAMAVSGEVLEALLRGAARRSSPGRARWRRDGTPRQHWGQAYPAVYAYGVSNKWRNAFVQRMFLHHKRGVMAAVPEHLLTTGLRPGMWGGVVRWLIVEGAAREGGEETTGAIEILNELFDDDTFSAPPCYGLPEAERNGARFAHELLNGMAPAALRKTDDPDRFRIVYQYTDLPFDDPYDRGEPDQRDVFYRLPNCTVELVKVDGLLEVDTVTLAYRSTVDLDRYKAGGLGAYDPPITVHMRDAAEPAWRKSAARRITMGCSLLSGQIDSHIAMGHLVTEWASVAMSLSGMSAEHPVRRILAPRVAEVVAINRFADDIIWGDKGLFATCSALSGSGVRARMYERLSGVDWKTWKPRSRSEADNHYAPRVMSSFYWDVIRPYVRDALGWDAARPLGTRLPWFGNGPEREQMMSLFRRVAEPELMHRKWDDAPRHVWADPAEFADKPDGTRAWTEGSTEEDVIDLVSFILYHATLGHSWPNVRQVQCVGDPSFASPGMRLGLDEGPQDASWEDAAAPLAADAVFMLLTADVLTHLNVDTFGKEIRFANHEQHGLPRESQVPRDPYLTAFPSRSLAERFRRADLGARVTGPYEDPLVSDPDLQLSRCNR